jgi:FkbM family methyltransferase
MRGSLRLSDLASDMLSIWELSVDDTYGIDDHFAPDLIVDGGGNIGLFTLRRAAAASLGGESKVKFVIVEPLPRNVDQIRKHLKMNRVDAEIMPTCLGGIPRSIPFYCREAIRSSFDSKEAYTSVVELPVLRLQDVIGSSPAKRILIKLDIEGMELEALRAFVPMEERAVYIVGELHNYEGESMLMEELFREHGWTFGFSHIYDNYAHFRACSPAALPFIPSMSSPNFPQSSGFPDPVWQGTVGVDAPLKS